MLTIPQEPYRFKIFEPIELIVKAYDIQDSFLDEEEMIWRDEKGQEGNTLYLEPYSLKGRVYEYTFVATNTGRKIAQVYYVVKINQ